MQGNGLVQFAQPASVSIAVRSIRMITVNPAGKVLVGMADGSVICFEESLGEVSAKIFDTIFPCPKLAVVEREAGQ